MEYRKRIATELRKKKKSIWSRTHVSEADAVKWCVSIAAALVLVTPRDYEMSGFSKITGAPSSNGVAIDGS